MVTHALECIGFSGEEYLHDIGDKLVKGTFLSGWSSVAFGRLLSSVIVAATAIKGGGVSVTHQETLRDAIVAATDAIDVWDCCELDGNLAAAEEAAAASFHLIDKAVANITNAQL